MAKVSSTLNKYLADTGRAAALQKQAAPESLDIFWFTSIAARLKAVHTATKNYNAHLSLDEAFEDVNETMDTFLECSIGVRDMSEQSSSSVDLRIPDDSLTGILEYCRKLWDEFKSKADSIAGDDTVLQTCRDDVGKVFYQLFYRLKRLTNI